MDGLPDEVRATVRWLNADLLLGLLVLGELPWLACELMMAGLETPALVAPAGERAAGLTLGEAEPLVRQALVEAGVEPVDVRQAPWGVAREVAWQMLRGDLLPEVGASWLWGLSLSCGHVPGFDALLQPLDEWQEMPPKDRDDEAVRAEVLRLAPAVIEASDLRLRR